LFSNKDLKKLILPLVVEQFLAVTIGMINTIMVSSCGEAAVSGISLVESINFLLVTMFSSIATGGAVVVAQFIGKGEKWNANIAAKQLEFSAFGISLLLCAFAVIFRDALLQTIFQGIEADVMANARIYFLLSALSYPSLAVYNSGAALFRSMGDSKTSMYISIFMNIIHIIGNTISIYALNAGVAGVAVATLITRTVGAVIITILLLNPNRTVHIDRLRKLEFRPDMIKRIMAIGVPSGLENSIFQLGKILTISIVASFGTVATTANAIGGNIASLQLIPGSAVALALMTVVGQCIGAKDYEGVKKYVKKLMFFAYAALWGITLIMVLLHKPLLSMYNLSEESLNLTVELLIIHVVFSVLIWPFAFALPNALRAASDAKYTMVVSLATMWLFRIGLSFLLTRFFHFQIHAIWVAMCIDWFFRAILFIMRFKSGKWKDKAVV
jgi:putative efflux protein, MATE family